MLKMLVSIHGLPLFGAVLLLFINAGSLKKPPLNHTLIFSLISVLGVVGALVEILD